jgi:hypothetical protein
MKCADGFCTKKLRVYCLYYKKVDRSMRRNTEHSENDKSVRLIALRPRPTKNFQNFPYQVLLTHNAQHPIIANIKLLFTGRRLDRDILHRFRHSPCMQHEVLIVKFFSENKYNLHNIYFVVMQLQI